MEEEKKRISDYVLEPWKTLTKLQTREGRVWILQLPASHVPPAQPIPNMPARFSIAPIWSKVSPHHLKIPHSHANNNFLPRHAGSVFIATISSCHTPLHCPSNAIKRDFVVLNQQWWPPHSCPGASSSPTTTHPHQHKISLPFLLSSNDKAKPPEGKHKATTTSIWAIIENQ